MAFVTVEDRGLVRWLTLSAPGKKNAVPQSGWDELAAAVGEFDTSDQRVLVITGDGEDFCAGADLGGERSRSVADNTARMRRSSRAALALHQVGRRAHHRRRRWCRRRRRHESRPRL